jgi:4-hydroxy-3-methylbut-2-enyl diphosphate reductase
VARHGREGNEVILIGHRGHPEVEGTMGQYRREEANGRGGIHLVETVDDVARLDIRDPTHVAFVTQTTLSMDDTAVIIDALKARFPGIVGPKRNDICYATQNRQDAVKDLAHQCNLVLVVGSPNSSNSNRLKEIALKLGKPAYLIDGPDDIRPEWLKGVDTIGLTAGASAPEVLVGQVIERLRAWGAQSIEENVGKPEQVTFGLPKNLIEALGNSRR